MTGKLVSATPDAEKHMAYVARVSNTNKQDSDKLAVRDRCLYGPLSVR